MGKGILNVDRRDDRIVVNYSLDGNVNGEVIYGTKEIFYDADIAEESGNLEDVEGLYFSDDITIDCGKLKGRVFRYAFISEWGDDGRRKVVGIEGPYLRRNIRA
jgi:hypothetical protein